ncbi:MAG: hypothetical protein Q8Q45_14555 [Methylococcaceae bacterium]|nr:hypothetical protein [Methylococcaceae bacterium]MDP3933560.1 hypothetical protein [Methylococcaceae bacterium]
MIFLSRSEIEYMLMMLELTSSLRQVLEGISVSGGNIDDDQADELRDLCNDKLDVRGYDENYNPNEDGKRLEALVDKLYLG